MKEYTPDFLAQALYAYMETFELFQEDHSDYCEESGERKSEFKGRHVFIGDEVPNIQGFCVKMRIPPKNLQKLYNENVLLPEACPWVEAVDIFKAFMETTIASAAALDLVNATFAKSMMKQWLGWQTDSITIEDNVPKQLPATEAANRIHNILLAAQKKMDPTVVAEVPKPKDVPCETKRRPRKTKGN